MKKALVLKIQGKAEVGSGRSIQATYKTMPGTVGQQSNHFTTTVWLWIA